MNDYQDKMSRKWLLTINNPKEHGFTHQELIRQLQTIKSCVYWCMADEIGQEGTYHTHLYICCKNGVRASTLHNKFNGAHRDIAKGTSQDNRDYVQKAGKWANTDKADTSVEGTFEEWGELPIERQGHRQDIDDLYAMIKDGLSDFEILEQCPNYLLNMDKIEKARQIVIQEKYRRIWRDLEVTYIWGDTGSGKTRGVMEKYGYEKVFRVTDYTHPWDNYKGQDVVIFEEFRSSVRITELLTWLDGYPVELPSRYANKFACFTKVYIITNIPLSMQYKHLQIESYEDYRAFLRRIHHVHYYHNGIIEKGSIDMDSSTFHIVPDEENPFSEKR